MHPPSRPPRDDVHGARGLTFCVPLGLSHTWPRISSSGCHDNQLRGVASTAEVCPITAVEAGGQMAGPMVQLGRGPFPAFQTVLPVSSRGRGRERRQQAPVVCLPLLARTAATPEPPRGLTSTSSPPEGPVPWDHRVVGLSTGAFGEGEHTGCNRPQLTNGFSFVFFLHVSPPVPATRLVCMFSAFLSQVILACCISPFPRFLGFPAESATVSSAPTALCRALSVQTRLLASGLQVLH